MKNAHIAISLFLGLFLGMFLIAAVVDESGGGARRLPKLPSDTKFQVTAAIVELKAADPVLGGSSLQEMLNDIPKRSEIGRDILAAKDGSGDVVRARTTRMLKQGDDFPVSYSLPPEKDTASGPDPYLRHVDAKVHLLAVDTLQTAEFDVTGGSEWYADLMKTNHSTGFGSSIPGYGCFNLGKAEMFPLFVQPEGSAWIVLSIAKVN